MNRPDAHELRRSRRYRVTFFMQIFMQICITYRHASPRIARKCTFFVYFSTKKAYKGIKKCGQQDLNCNMWHYKNEIFMQIFMQVF